MTSNLAASWWPAGTLLLAAVMWGVFWYPLRVLDSGGVHGLWSSLIIYFLASIAGLFLCGRALRAFLQFPLLLFLIAIANGWTNVSFILAVIDGNVVRVLLLFYLSPVWTIILGWLILGEKIHIMSVVTLVVAMLGGVMMLWEPDMGMPWPAGEADWLALSSGFAFAFSNIFVRKGQYIPVRVKTTATWLGVFLTAIVLLGIQKTPVPDIQSAGLIWVLAIAAVMVVIMTLAVQFGVTHMPVQRSAIILLFEIVAGAISSQILTEEVILPKEWIGGALIMIAAYATAIIQHRSPE